MDGRAEPVERGKMFGHAVAHVALKAVARMRGAETGHQPVARDLGYDGRRCDRSNQAIAADDRLAIAAGIDAVAAVDKDKLRLDRQRGNSAGERPERRAQNVVAVDTPR